MLLFEWDIEKAKSNEKKHGSAGVRLDNWVFRKTEKNRGQTAISMGAIGGKWGLTPFNFRVALIATFRSTLLRLAICAYLFWLL